MKKENLKTIILTLLIFSSVILSIQIWLLNPVWSENYNPLGFLADWMDSEEGININDTGAFNSVFSPRSFVFTYNDGRLIFNTTEQEGNEIRNAFNTTVKTALESSAAVSISEEDWQTTLKSNSIYADYSVPVSVTALASFLGSTKTPAIPLNSFNQAVITVDQIASTSYICFRNSTENIQVRIPVSGISELKSLYQRHSGQTKESYSYAFEINLDKKVDGGSVQQTVLMDSYVLLPVEPVRMNTIRSEKVEFTEEGIDRILELFGYNPKTAWKYTENNGNILFIDSESTLKLHQDTGYIEYIATENGGLTLPGDGKLASIASGCGKLLDDIFKLFSIDPNVTLFINSPLDNNSSTNYMITFDYLFNGNSIQSKDHSCKIIISGGKIREFYANVKNYYPVLETGEENALDVLENLYVSQNQETLIINSLFTGYTDAEGEMPMQWQATVQGSDEIITVTAAEPQ